MQRNARLLSDSFRSSNIGEVFHALNSGNPSTLIFIRFKLDKKHVVDLDKIQRKIEEHAQRLTHKWTGDPSYDVTFGNKDFARDMFYKNVSHKSPLRLSTSFGFSSTTLTFFQANKTIWARISAGCESLPALDQLYSELLSPILLNVDRLK